MKYSIHLISIAFVLSLSLILSGCGNVTPQPTPTITTDSAITTDCIVSYFRQGKAPYITSQQHRYSLSSEALQINANEPDSSYEFTLKKSQFSQSNEMTSFLSALPAKFVSQPLATAFFYSFLAGADVLPTETLVSGENIKLEGQWYHPLQADWPRENIQVILLKNINTNRIDTVGITQFENEAPVAENITSPSLPVKARWMAKAYNFRYSKDLNGLAPRQIDLFDIQGGIASKELIVQIEYKTVQKNNPLAVSE